jgi:hypothetical protein
MIRNLMQEIYQQNHFNVHVQNDNLGSISMGDISGDQKNLPCRKDTVGNFCRVSPIAVTASAMEVIKRLCRQECLLP